MRWVLRYVLSGVPAPPPLGRSLLATLGLLLLVALNWQFRAEVWPSTPAVRLVVLPAGLALLWLALLPQVLRWSWRWLRAYAGPGWLRLLLLAGYLAGAISGMLFGICAGGFSLLWLLADLSGDPGGW